MSSSKTLRVVTLGCSKNSVDTEHLLARLPSDGFVIVGDDFDGYVDILLINTCGFIGDAKEESIAAIMEAVALKSRAEIGKLLVFGCLSQRYMSELKAEIPEVDAWFGARDLSPIWHYLGVKPDFSRYRLLASGHSYAYLKISEGCDRRCSYCAIPFIRGSHKSVPEDELVREAAELAASGVKELILIAQDTTYYGLDLYGRRTLARLIEKLSQVEGIEWIRIHYSYPAAFPDDVLDQMANNPKVCKYLDIPLQHIDDAVLAHMHRGVDSKWTRELIKRMRDKVPGVALRTTMIVGYPGESEEAFERLLAFVRDAKFERLGAFTYSEEEGTYGAKHFSDNISQQTKEERLDALMELQREISLAANEARVGMELRLLVDARMGDNLVCRSEFESPDVDGEIVIYNAPNSVAVGDFVRARIVGAEEYDLVAELL